MQENQNEKTKEITEAASTTITTLRSKETQALLFIAIATLLVSLAAMYTAFRNSKPQLGVVDVDTILKSEAARLATQGGFSQKKVQEVTEHLKDTLRDVSDQTGVVLLSKSITFNRVLPDYTQTVQEALHDKNSD
jgi:hypothetical protein